VAGFLARALDGPYPPGEASDRAAAVEAQRIPDPDETFAAVSDGVGARRTIGEIVGAATPTSVEAGEPAGVP
jgi:hypothetical protein